MNHPHNLYLSSCTLLPPPHVVPGSEVQSRCYQLHPSAVHLFSPPHPCSRSISASATEILSFNPLVSSVSDIVCFWKARKPSDTNLDQEKSDFGTWESAGAATSLHCFTILAVANSKGITDVVCLRLSLKPFSPPRWVYRADSALYT